MNKNKLDRNKKIDIIVNIVLFLIVTIIFYFAPYTHDDWAWGTSLGIERLTTFFDNYNGRWAGNLVVLLLTRCRILKAFVCSITMYLIVKLIRKLTNHENYSLSYIAIILFLLMPVGIFAQALAWTSGFSNYTISFLLILYYIYLNRDMFKGKLPDIKNVFFIPFLILGFVASLFLENLTIYNIILSIFVIIYQFIKNRKVLLSNVGYLIGSISGAILMFSNSAYRSIVSSDDTYRSIEKGNIITRSINTYFETMYKYLFNDNFVIIFVISLLVLFVIYRYLKNNYSKINNIRKYIVTLSGIVIMGYLVYNLYTYINGDLNMLVYQEYKEGFEGFISILFYISLVVSSIIAIEDKDKRFKVLFYLFSIIILTAPLFIVTPIGPRNFIQNYILYILIVCELFDYLVKFKTNNVKYILMMLSVFLLLCYFVIFAYVFRVESVRLDKINNSNDLVLRLPKLPYEEYMQHPNPDHPEFVKRFKRFYKVDKNKEVVFVNYHKNK